jgi:thymidylate synthase ThyX
VSYDCKILEDSISEIGKRLTTMQVTFPRFILAEVNTHRALSRNSASSRAIPFSKQLQRVMENPFIPERFPINGKGMQPQGYYEEISIDHQKAKEAWLKARDYAIKQAKKLAGIEEAWLEDSGSDFRSDKPQYLHVHKQIANRLLEPFQWHTVIISATEWANFFKLRTHTDAQFEFKRIADLMYDCYHARNQNKYENNACSLHDFHPTIQKLKAGEWHCPLVFEEDDRLIDTYIDYFRDMLSTETEELDKFIELKKQISVARCARISYLTHDNKRDIEKDFDLFDKLVGGDPKHTSPTEHVATPEHLELTEREYSVYKRILDDPTDEDHLWVKESCQVASFNNKYWFLPRIGNYFGWKQMRKEFPDENCTSFIKEAYA